MKLALLTTDNRGPFREFDKPEPWFGMAPEALLSGLAGLPELQVHVVSCIRQPVRAPQKLADNIWFHSLHVPKIGWIRTGYLGCLRAVRRQLKIIQPDLVHGQGTETECGICAVFSGFPNVITLLGIMREMARITRVPLWSFHGISGRLESLTLRRTAGVLCNSRFTEAKVRARTRKTWLVPNALREAFFLKPPAAQRSVGCNLLNVGTVCPEKRQNELLDMAEELRAEGLDFRLSFLGVASRTTPYRSRFLDRVQNSPHFSYIGFKTISEMIEHFDAATALVHVSAVESFGLAVAEALSRNLKFFGFESGGVADIITGVPGAEGFADGDWPALKQALARWMHQGCPRPAPSAAIMRDRYHPQLIAQRHLEIYRELLVSGQ